MQLAPDRAEIVAALERQTARWHELGEECWLELRAINPDVGTVYHARFSPEKLADAAQWAAEMNATGRGLYSVRSPIRYHSAGTAAKDADILAAFTVFADCDDERSARNLLDFAGPRPTYTIVTGRTPHPRPHPYWELSEPVRDMDAWRALQKQIARALGSDDKVVNPSRIMRLPGTVTYPPEHKRAKGYVSELVTAQYPDRQPAPLEQLQRAFGTAESQQDAPRPGAGFDADTGHGSLDRALAAAHIKAGEHWHDNVVRLVGSYVSRGLGDEEIHAITDGFTLPGWSIDQTRGEVQKAIDGARAKGWTPETYAQPEALKAPECNIKNLDIGPGNFDVPARALDLEWFDDIEAALEDSYVVKGVIGSGAMSVVYGASNSGKTFFALDLAYHVAIGATWRGHRVAGGGVLYLAAEGGKGLVNRVAALRREHGVCDVPLALRRAGLDLLKSQADLQHVVDLAAEVGRRAPLRLIVVDTLSRVIAGGDENSPADMTALIRNIGAIQGLTGAHVMVVHHSGKDAARGARGHSSLRAATDTEIEVTAPEEEDQPRIAQVTKQRDYAGSEAWGFTLKSVHLGVDQDGDDVTSCILEHADAGEALAARKAKAGMGAAQKQMLECWEILQAEGVGGLNPGGHGFPDPGRFWCVPYDDLRRLFTGKYGGADAGRAFRRTLASLMEERGLLCMADNLVWRPDQRKKEGIANA